MDYIISFLEGIITFVSPCLLPMLPIYISYFASGTNDKKKTIKNVLGFILGFTVVFVVLGAFAGSVGRLLREYQTAVNIITGAIVIILGLNFMEILNIKFLNSTKKLQYDGTKDMRFGTSVVFGVVFSIGWTPCVGAFLGSALMLASNSGSVLQGVLMLITYSLGLGIPFMISALLINQLRTTFDFIKKHYGIITKISGGFLVAIGTMMMTGVMGRFLSLLQF